MLAELYYRLRSRLDYLTADEPGLRAVYADDDAVVALEDEMDREGDMSHGLVLSLWLDCTRPRQVYVDRIGIQVVKFPILGT